MHLKMKKITAILGLIALAYACDEGAIDNEKNVTYTELQEICSMDYESLTINFGSKCLMVSPYLIVGEKVNESLLILEKLARTDKIKSEDFRATLVGLIESKLPKELTKLSDAGYTDTESNFYTVISQGILTDDLNTLNFRISCIEDLILRSKSLNLEAEKRLLVYCSVDKGISNYLYQLSLETKQETWDDCFRKKQEEMMKKGFFEKALCVIDWPRCLGAMAADCVLEQIS